MPAGKPLKPLETFTQGFGIGNLPPIRDPCQGFHTKINANDWPGGGFWLCRFFMDTNGDVPAPGLFGDGGTPNLGIPGEVKLFLESQGTESGKLNALFKDMNGTRETKPANAFLPALELGIATLPAPFALFFQVHFAKEMCEGMIQVDQGLLRCTF